MKKFMKKMSKILCLVLVMCMVISPIALATNSFDVSGTDSNLQKTTDNLLKQVLGVVSTAGYVIAVIMVIWVGIQYMIATPAKKAELKGKLWSMAIGCILIVGASTILTVISNLGLTIIKDSAVQL